MTDIEIDTWEGMTMGGRSVWVPAAGGFLMGAGGAGLICIKDGCPWGLVVAGSLMTGVIVGGWFAFLAFGLDRGGR